MTITAPKDGALGPSRSPLSLAIVIDRSGSMHGAAIENAKTAALSMLGQLERDDAFAVVTYSSASETVVPMQRATDANKAAARAAIEQIEDDGGTCISCGLDTGAREVARSPIRGGLRRMLLISDGQANEGTYERDELARLAADHAARGVSISSLGVGLDFDEATMRRLAEVGRGNYYFAADSGALSALFSRELSRLGQTIASDVRLVVTPSPGVVIADVYGYPATRNGPSFVVPVADLVAGETRKVVLGVRLVSRTEGPFDIAEIELAWRRAADAASRRLHVRTSVDVIDEPEAVAASVDRETLRAVERALSARAIEDAASAYDRHGLSDAQQVLERRSARVRANAASLGGDTVEALEAASREVLDGFAKAPAHARKAASVKAHELAR